MDATLPPAPSSDALTLRRLRFVVSAASLAGLSLCPHLWLPGRVFPEAPIWSGLPPLAPWLQTALFGGLWISLAWVAVARPARPTIVVLAVSSVVLALWDQVRWQPWCYQYFCMLVAILWGSRPDSSDERRRAALDACRLIVAGTYFWSGVQKLNFSFADDVFPWMIGPLLPDGWSAPPFWSAHLAAVIEIGIGGGLLIGPLRRGAVAAAILMHGFVLLLLGPFGHNWNTVVWPWNVAMPACAWLLFWNARDVTAWKIVVGQQWNAPRLEWPRWAALLLFGVLPSLSFVGLWDAYLSAALYSGNTMRANLEFSEAAVRRLPKPAWQQSDSLGDGRRDIDLRYWAMDELNVPAYPARRVFRAIAAAARKNWAPADEDVTLVIFERPDWRTGERTETRE